MISWQYFAADYYVVLERVAAIFVVLIVISGLDDLFIDVLYWMRRFARWRQVKKGGYKALSVDDLHQRSEQLLAIMVPAWKEYDVIAAMIENMVKVLDYKKYVVFVGTYCNDAETIAEVERMRRRYKQLHRVEVPNPGPTCKADCLNWVIQAIFKYESQANVEFSGMVLHDSEDVLHPLELKFYNYLLPRMDMIQLPVMSLERKWYELVAGTYMDEFAESHGKDMLVRESVAGVVPSAGVGTCFSRKALRTLTETTQNQPFNTNSLTEDYDIGNRLGRMGMRSIFAVFPVQFIIKHDKWFSKGKTWEEVRNLPLCVREYFPDTFRTAYRQKSRWTLGIGLQSWEQISFSGSFMAKYLLLRDRKGVLAALISVLAYFLLAQFVLFQIAAFAGIWTVYYPSMLATDGIWIYILWFNGFSIISRILHRVYFVTELYGWRHGLMSVPRMIVSNCVNFMAVCRAWRLFFSYLFLGKAMAWDKTMHDFPSEDNLADQKLRIGELLQLWQAVDAETLDKALAEQERLKLPLGRVMVFNGWLDDETLAEAISYQSAYPRAVVNVENLQQFSQQLPLAICLRWRVLYLGPDGQGRHVLAVGNPLLPQAEQELSALLGPLVQHIARESEIVEGLSLYRKQAGPIHEQDESASSAQQVAAVPLLGDLLIERGVVERAVFETAMNQYRPQVHGRIGDYLVAQGILSRDAIDQTMSEQARLRHQHELAMLAPTEEAAV